jgi:hypothetical protein
VQYFDDTGEEKRIYLSLIIMMKGMGEYVMCGVDQNEIKRAN